MGAIQVLRMIRLRKIMTGSNKRLKTRDIQRIAKKYKYEEPLTYDMREEIELHLKEAAAAYDAFRPKAHKSRVSYLYKIAEELAGEDGKEISHHFKQLINRERIRSHYKHITSCKGRTRGGGVDSRDRRRTATTFREEWNWASYQYSKSEETPPSNGHPFRKEPLQSLVREQMDFAKWEEILTKSISLPPNMEEGIQIWYDYVQNFEDNPENYMEYRRILW